MVEINEPRLSAWMHSLIGPGRMFVNESAWARKSGLSTSTFNAILGRGSAEVDNLVKIARAADRNPLDLFEMAGILTPEEIQGFTERPTHAVLGGLEREALEILQVVPEGTPRRVFLLNMRALAGAARDLAHRGLIQQSDGRRG